MIFPWESNKLGQKFRFPGKDSSVIFLFEIFPDCRINSLPRARDFNGTTKNSLNVYLLKFGIM